MARDSGNQRIDPSAIRIKGQRNTWCGGDGGGDTLAKTTRKSNARGKPIYVLGTPDHGVRTPIPILSWNPDYSKGHTVHNL